MATLKELCRTNALVQYDANLGPKQQIERQMYFTAHFRDWLVNDAQHLKRGPGCQATPYEQMRTLFGRYVAGKSMVGDYHHMNPQWQGVWELTTTDIRVFGWFKEPKVFISCFGVLKRDLIDKSNKKTTYKKYVNKTIRYRNSFNLDEPKFTKLGLGHVL